MLKMSAQLDGLIRSQESEIAHIQAQAQKNVATAKERLALLKRARAALTTDVDDVIARLRAVGLWPNNT